MEIKSQNDKIVSATFDGDTFKLTITINSYCTRRKTDDSNLGTIIENYRILRKNGELNESENYFIQNKKVIVDFISKIKNQQVLKPDYIQIFKTQDKNRNYIIDLFSQKVINSLFLGDSSPDYSDFYVKLNKDFSVKDFKGTIEEGLKLFEYTLPDKLKDPINRIWIIDDTIDTGLTVEIFLRKLLDCGLINENTQIHCFILYNNLRKDSGFKGLTFDRLIEEYKKASR